ncbi:MAG: ABC transporter transmembrane domain-containing protein, partial [Verrucomicrobiota bacterium]
MRTVFRIFSYLRQYPLLATCLLSCAVLMALMSLVFPETLDRVISDAVPAKDGELLLKLVGIALFGFAVYNGLNALRIIINNTLEQKVIFDLRSDLYRRIQRLPMRWFDEKRTGDVMTRVTEDVTATERVLIDGIEIGVIAVLQMLAVGVYLFIKDVPLALVALIPVPFLVFGALAYTRTAPQRHRRVRSATSEMNS